MTYPLYIDDAIDLISNFYRLREDDSGYTRFIFFADESQFYDYFTSLSETTVNSIEGGINALLQKITNNNNATYIGTIQSTEQVNRVSDKYTISKAVNLEENYGALGRAANTRPNINNKILRALYNICYLQEGRECFGWKRPTGNAKQIRSAIKYECLYAINEITAEYNSTKRAQSMKEKDIQDMTTALENVFPIATRFMDYQKIQYIWEYISTKERLKYVVSKRTGHLKGRKPQGKMKGNMIKDYIYTAVGDTMEPHPDREKYPYRRDWARKVGGFGDVQGKNEVKGFSKKRGWRGGYHGHTQAIFEAHIKGKKGEGETGITTQSAVTEEGALVAWNNKIQEIVSLEPGTTFVSASIFKVFEKSCIGNPWKYHEYAKGGKKQCSYRGQGDTDLLSEREGEPELIANLKGPFNCKGNKSGIEKDPGENPTATPIRTHTEPKTPVTITTPVFSIEMEKKNPKTKEITKHAGPGYLTFARFRDMCNIMKKPDGKTYKRKIGLLYYLVRDDFYNEVYQRYILANHGFNEPAFVISAGPGRDITRGYNGPEVNGVARGYKELKPATFKADFFDLKNDTAFDKSISKTHIVTVDTGRGIVGSAGQNPFKIRLDRRSQLDKSEPYYGLPLAQSSETALENHAWQLFREPETMNPKGVDEIVPFHTKPLQNSKGKVWIPKVDTEKGVPSLHFKDNPSVWGWAPQELGDKFYEILTSKDMTFDRIGESFSGLIGKRGGYKNKKSRTRRRRTRRKGAKKKSKSRKRNTRKR